MSGGSLTRILNNQIYNQTIIASQKIAAGSIVGSLFASNITVPGDLLIAGNLFVLGNSIQTTISSTNTYVNDPLLTLNNGFTGTNTYDEGLIFNRGSATNTGFFWSEYFKEFRLVYTSETGTTYGNINATGLANLAVSNFVATGISTFANLITGTIIASSANISTAYHNTLNVAGNVLLGLTQAAAVNNTPIGNAIASSGAFTTLFANSQVTFSANTASTNTGTGALVVNGGVGIGGNLFIGGNLNVIGNSYVISSNSGVFYGNAVGAGAIYAGVVGYVPQPFTTIQTSGNANNYIQLNLQNINGGASASGDIVVTMDTGNATVGFIDMGINSSGFVGGAGNELNYPGDGYLYVQGNAVTGSGNLLISTDLANDIVFSLNGQGSANEIARFNYAQNALLIKSTTAATTTTSGALQVAGGAGIAGNLVVGGNIQAAGATALGSTLNVAGVTSITNTTNATAISASGALQVAGGASFTKDVWIGGNLFVSNIIGVTANVITVTDPLLYLRNSNISAYNYDIGFYSAFTGTGLGTINQYQHTSIFRDPLDNTWKFVSNLAEPSASYITLDGTTVYDPIKAGNLQLTVTTDSTSATTGALIVAGGAGIGGNIFQSGAYYQTSASNYIFATTPTSVNAFTSATTFNIGGSSGTLTINNPTIVGTSITQTLFDATALTVNFARTGNVTMNAPTGTTTLQGNAVVGSVTQSTNYTNGALTVGGGIGANGSLNLSRNNVITLGADLISNVVYSENAVQIVSSANAVSRISIQNISTGSSATSEFVVTTSSGSNIGGYASFGIAGTNTASGVVKPLDAFLYTSSGSPANLVISGAKDLVLAANGLSSVGIRISATNANVGVQYSTAATSSTTGALTSVGGISTKANLYVSRGATINSDNSIEAFTVKSSTSGNVAIFANVVGTAGTSTTETVIIGGSNLAVQTGVILKVNGQTSMMLPVGPQAARPSSQGGVDVAGMIRFNSTSNLLEYYDGTNWQIAGSTFTVISDRQFSGNVGGGYGNVDGTNTTFTIQSNATTSGTLVAINGVMQFPTLAYSVSGATLTFTEPPAPGDVIDVRILTTTATVSSIANGNGVNQFVADNTGVSLWSGTNSTVEQVLIDPVGNFNFLNQNHITYTQAPVNIPTAGSPVVIDTFSQTAYTTGKYTIQSKVGTANFETYESHVITDGAGNAYISTFGIVNNGTSFGTISANVVSGNVRVYYTSTIAQANVKAFGTYIV
jgi:hypothetical protein